MPKFLDSHSLGSVTEEQLKQAQRMPKDEYGIVHDNIMYNKFENRAYCLLEAPDKESVKKHHEKLGMKCDWIMEVKTTA
jgi:hypothetical protein